MCSSVIWQIWSYRYPLEPRLRLSSNAFQANPRVSARWFCQTSSPMQHPSTLSLPILLLNAKSFWFEKCGGKSADKVPCGTLLQKSLLSLPYPPCGEHALPAPCKGLRGNFKSRPMEQHSQPLFDERIIGGSHIYIRWRASA
jgi:hypothetical protein